MLDKAAFPYAAGFRSQTEEVATPVPLETRGEVPAWLTGTLLRTGPAKFEVGGRTYNHWFDGLAMLHRFAFDRSRVTYASRFLQSNAFTAAEKTGKIAYGEFATDPCRTLFGRVAAITSLPSPATPKLCALPSRVRETQQATSEAKSSRPIRRVTASRISSRRASVIWKKTET